MTTRWRPRRARPSRQRTRTLAALAAFLPPQHLKVYVDDSMQAIEETEGLLTSSSSSSSSEAAASGALLGMPRLSARTKPKENWPRRAEEVRE